MLITYDEAAEILGIQRKSVRQLVNRGILQPMMYGNDLRRRYLLREQVLHRLEHPRSRHHSWHARHIDKLTWQYDMSLERLRMAL
jgi:excisionase family DNA binding protein